MARIELRIREFNDMVKYLKRLDDIGDDFFLIGDVILPSIREPRNRPGKHIVRSQIPRRTEYDEVLYGIGRLSEVSKQLGDVKGKKEVLYIEQTETGIWVTVNDLTVQLAGIYADEDKEVVEQTAPENNHFDDYINMVPSWEEIPHELLNDIKRGNVANFEDDRHTTRVRVARDLFKLRGVSRLSAPVDFTVSIHVASPVPDPETIVIGNMGSSNGLLSMHFTSPVIEAIHYYSFSPFY